MMLNAGKPQLVILPKEGTVPPKFKRITSLKNLENSITLNGKSVLMLEESTAIKKGIMKKNSYSVQNLPSMQRVVQIQYNGDSEQCSNVKPKIMKTSRFLKNNSQSTLTDNHCGLKKPSQSNKKDLVTNFKDVLGEIFSNHSSKYLLSNVEARSEEVLNQTHDIVRPKSWHCIFSGKRNNNRTCSENNFSSSFMQSDDDIAMSICSDESSYFDDSFEDHVYTNFASPSSFEGFSNHSNVTFSGTCNTIMGFNTELQGQSSHEALVKLQDTEIRLLETIKKCVTHRVKCDRDYSQSLTLMLSVAGKFENTENFSSPVFKAWSTIITETENIGKQIRANADRMCANTIEKLVELISEKKLARKTYVDERNKMEQELNKLKDQVQKSHTDYEKAMTKFGQDKAKYEDAVAKGKTGKKLEDVKSKYQKTTGQLHRVHNDYVACLHNVSLHQRDFLRTTLPGLLDCQQEIQESMIQQCKEILHEYTSLTDTCNEEFSKSQSEISKAIGAVNPSGEHDEFLNKYRTDPLEATKLEFDTDLFLENQMNLQPDVLAVNDLTVESLRQSDSNYQTEVTVFKDRKTNKQTSLQTCENDLSKLPPYNEMSDKDKNSFYTMKKNSKYLQKEIAELNCYGDKFDSLHTLLSSAISILDGDLPSACVFPDGTDPAPDKTDKSASPNFVAEPGNSSSSNLASIEAHAQIAKDKFNTFKKSLADKFKKQQSQNPPEPPRKDFLDNTSQDKPLPPKPGGIAAESKGRKKNEYTPNDTQPSTESSVKRAIYKYEQCEVSNESHSIQNSTVVNRPIQEEDWFHGVLPREEVIRLLKEDGDYLVRESKNKKTGDVQYVLSVMWTDPKHFIIQAQDNQWRFESSMFNSIQELIRDQHSSGLPVTKKSQAILKKPILKESWELSNDDILLGAKLGNGNFGDVFKGTFCNEEVAVKTCKETLSEDQKKKFLQEGRILKQYDHPNIVRFIGIGAQRQPVMIVMEFCAGGALLQYLRAEGKKTSRKVTNKQLVKMCVDASAGMSYLEDKQCIHRDLAARNCLIGKDSVVKISDFGMSREEEEYTVSGGLKQIPIKWTAPEALNFGTYTSACDVWSFGILMWEVFSFGQTPYPGLTNTQARERVDEGYRMPSPEGTPNGVHDLMLRCWEAEPKDRLKFSEIHRELQKILKSL